MYIGHEYNSMVQLRKNKKKVRNYVAIESPVTQVRVSQEEDNNSGAAGIKLERGNGYIKARDTEDDSDFIQIR